MLPYNVSYVCDSFSELFVKFYIILQPKTWIQFAKRRTFYSLRDWELGTIQDTERMFLPTTRKFKYEQESSWWNY